MKTALYLMLGSSLAALASFISVLNGISLDVFLWLAVLALASQFSFLIALGKL